MNPLLEKKNQLLDKLDKIVEDAKISKRSLSGSEQNQFSKIKSEVEEINRQLQLDSLGHTRSMLEPSGISAEKRQQLETETRALLDYIIKNDMRSLSASGSGSAVVPTEISKMIVDKVVNSSMLLQRCTKFNTNADLSIPITDFTLINSSYLSENSPISDTGQDFSSIKLQNKIIGSLIKISRSLLNRADFSVIEYLVGSVAKNLLWFIEKELITGTGGAGRLGGLVTLPSGQKTTTASVGAILPEELIDLQLKLPQLYQDQAVWVMGSQTLASLYKMKDSTGNFLFNRGNMSAGNDLMLLGKPVMLSDSMPTISTGAIPVYYLDPACLYVKFTQEVQVLTLDQAVATSYQYALLGSVEMDSAIAEVQGIVGLVGK